MSLLQLASVNENILFQIILTSSILCYKFDNLETKVKENYEKRSERYNVYSMGGAQKSAL